MPTFEERIDLIKRLEAIRGSVVIVYVTSTRQGLESAMAMDSIRKIHRHLEAITTTPNETIIDLFIHSNGGDGIVPWRLVTLIREYCKEFNVLVPHRAFSAATLTAMGADHIYMHKMGMLGPTDPKVANEFNPNDPTNPQQKIGINVEDVFSYISLIKEDVGITHEDELVNAWGHLASEGRIHPLALGNVKRFYAQSRMMAKKLLELHMDKNKDGHRIKEIANNLNSKLYFHGHPINRKEAKDDLGLAVERTTPRLEKAMWDLYEAYETEMSLEKPFNVPMEFKSRYPDLPVPTTSITVQSHDVNDLKIACIESRGRSDVAYVDLHIEGYKTLINGVIQEPISFSTTREEWIEEFPPVVQTSRSTNTQT